MTEPIGSWEKLLDEYRQFKVGQWCFRGDRTRPDGFKTSLERVAIHRWNRPWSELPEIERGLLRRFKREAHLYLTQEPAQDDTIGWLALMRHHGAPTRLLDWTYSFFVATYFAIDRAEPDEEPCIWALNLGKLRERAETLPHLRELLKKDPNAKAPETVDAIINHSPREAMVFPLNPLRMNRRLVLQQSVFLVPGDITHSFMENLRAVDEGDDLYVELRLSSRSRFWEEATMELLSMNINSATLFPGLDGFATNLNALVPFPALRAVDTEVGTE